MARRLKSEDRGFTLIETLIATMILAVGIVTVLQLFSGGLRSVEASEKYTRAIFHAREKMDQFLMEDTLTEGILEGEFDDGYRWRAQIYEIAEEGKPNLSVNRVDLRLVVEWTEGLKTKKVEFRSLALCRIIREEK